MRIEEYTNNLRVEAEHCPVRRTCPLAFLCTSEEQGRLVLPVIEPVRRDDMVWTDLSSRPKVYAIRKGLLLSTVYANHGREMPYGLFGTGFSTGLLEPYSPLIASNFYYFRNIVSGEICSFDSAEVARRLDRYSVREAESLTTAIMLNQTTANYGQMLTLAHRTSRNKIVSVLLRLNNQLSRNPEFDGDIPISHGDVALIAATERATASRQLKVLADEGLIDVGYRRLRLNPQITERFSDFIEATLPYYRYHLPA